MIAALVTVLRIVAQSPVVRAAVRGIAAASPAVPTTAALSPAVPITAASMPAVQTAVTPTPMGVV